MSEENEKLKIEIQKLRDENNRLKGEQGKPNIRGKKGSGKGKDVSSEDERKKREEKKKKKSKSKKKNIPIDRTEICEVDPSILPADAELRGYEPVVVQEILITTDNVEYRKEIFYSPSENRTYVGELPAFCNPYYTVFFTVPRKDRLTILDLLLCGSERTYRFDQKAFCLMADFKVSKKVCHRRSE